MADLGRRIAEKIGDENITHIIGNRANSVEESMRRNQRQIDQNKMTLGMQMDDKAFQNLLLETQV